MATAQITQPQERPTSERPEHATWWQQFWWRHSPHGELPLSSAASWLAHILILLLFWALAIVFTRLELTTPGVDVVSFGDGIGGGPAGGGDGMPEGESGTAGARAEVQPPAALADNVERQDDRIDLPELPKSQPENPRLVPSSSAETERKMSETDASLREANDMLRKVLAANQRRQDGAGGAGGDGGGAGGGAGGAGGGSGKGLGLGSGKGPGTGRGNLDVNSTAGRQARWVITYPTLPQSEYEQMLDSFGIELAYLQSDRKTMQYLGSVSGAGKKRTGDVNNEERMWWFWMGQNRLKDLDDAILLKHGLVASSDVVHLYTKQLELKLAEMEKSYLRQQWKTSDVERIATTNYKIFSGGPTGWHIEVTSLVLR